MTSQKLFVQVDRWTRAEGGGGITCVLQVLKLQAHFKAKLSLKTPQGALYHIKDQHKLKVSIRLGKKNEMDHKLFKNTHLVGANTSF